MKVPIADSLFLPYCKSSRCGNGNKDVTPTHFEWHGTNVEDARFVTDPFLKYAKGPGQVAFLLETFFLHPEDYVTATQVPFDYVLTHNAYFAQHKNWLWYPAGGSFVDFKHWGIHEKTKDVSILLSPKKQIWGHKKLHEVAERFKDRVDVFGLDRYTDKMEAIAPYRFSIVVEGEINDGYFAEKLIDCFAVGTIPIYWGCPKIGEYFDGSGIYRVEYINDIEFLLEKGDPIPYSQRMIGVENNLELAKKYRIPEDWIFDHYPFLFEGL